MALKNLLFPLEISENSIGGLEFSTNIAKTRSGAEFRNKTMQLPIIKYNIAKGIRSRRDISSIVGLFRICEGQFHSFLFRDPLDFYAENQILKPINVERTKFQMTKKYQFSGEESCRNITKPEVNTVKLRTENSAISEYNLDADSGIITLSSPLLLGNNLIANFNFFVEMRFDSDVLNIEFSSRDAKNLSAINLTEVR